MPVLNIHLRLKGPVGPAIVAAFEDEVEVRNEAVLSGELPDEASLHGLLARVRDLGLEVIDVHVTGAGRSDPVV